jgi:hypothetical protein
MTYFILNKDSSENINIDVSWEDWLGSDIITASTWLIPNPLIGAGQSNTSTSATVWISGGVLGAFYTVANSVTTASGRSTKRTIVVRIVSK